MPQDKEQLRLGLFPEETVEPSGRGVEAVQASDQVQALAARLPAGLRMGTSSWSFPGWAGIVYAGHHYSQDTLAREGLTAYATHPLLNSVGIDRTYYRPLTAEQFRTYAEAVHPDFRFLVKADRLLTSPAAPTDHGVRSPNPHFLDAGYAVDEVVGPMAAGLGALAGPLLFQFSPMPPNLVGGRAAFTEALERFLEALPRGPLYAVELRTPGLLTEAYAELLERTGVAHCYNVHPSMAPLERQLQLMPPFLQPALVVRWMLGSGLGYEAARDRYQPYDRLVDEDVDSRERIAVAVLDALVAEREAFVIANNKAEGSAPLTILRLAQHVVDWGAEAREEAKRG